ncbi:MAG: FtsQ-type POTRA domain-containing protein [Clostridia bacterium]|nr:FtsQ-type POTRA domain-containing protein [Clostridia bacterium]
MKEIRFSFDIDDDNSPKKTEAAGDYAPCDNREDSEYYAEYDEYDEDTEDGTAVYEFEKNKTGAAERGSAADDISDMQQDEPEDYGTDEEKEIAVYEFEKGKTKKNTANSTEKKKPAAKRNEVAENAKPEKVKTEDQESKDEEFTADEDWDDFEDIFEDKRSKRYKGVHLPLKKIVIAAVCIAGATAIVLASPIFAVKNIDINEMNYFTKEEICSKIGLSEGDNGVFYNKGRAEKLLMSDKYISSADISFKMPDTMVIEINENKICGYISYLGSYLYVDKEGRVIDIKSETTEKLPIIEGLSFDSFTQGEVIPVKNKEAFEAALIISRAMSKYDIIEKAVSINVADTSNIYAYIDNIKVLLGDTSRMEEKIKTMSEAVGEIPEGDRGTLDLRDLDKPIIFKYST